MKNPDVTVVFVRCQSGGVDGDGVHSPLLDGKVRDARYFFASSFMPHLEQVPGSFEPISGCMGQVYLAVLGSERWQPVRVKPATERASKVKSVIRDGLVFDFMFLVWFKSKEGNHESRANHLIKRSRRLRRAR